MTLSAKKFDLREILLWCLELYIYGLYWAVNFDDTFICSDTNAHHLKLMFQPVPRGLF